MAVGGWLNPLEIKESSVAAGLKLELGTDLCDECELNGPADFSLRF